MKFPFRIRPVVLKINPDRDKKYAIKICVYDRATQARVYKDTEYRVLFKDWDPKNRYVRRSASDHSTINVKVLGEIQELEKEIQLRIDKQQPINIHTLLHGERSNDNLFEYMRDLIDHFKVKAKPYAADTIRNYDNELLRLKKYFKVLYFSDIDTLWLRKYERLLNEEGLSNNSIHKAWKILKKVFNSAIMDGIIKHYPFQKYDNPKYEQPDTTHLTQEEVDAWEEALKKPLKEYHLVVGYYLLLGCYSGLRFSDWQRFSPSFVQGDRLILRAKKNGELVSLQMHSRLKRVVDMLLKLPPIMSEGKTNYYLKAVARVAGIMKNVSTHIGRHSFAVRCAELGISIETTSELMGITIKTCAIYYKITDRKVDEEFGKWDKPNAFNKREN
jgi:site-specific recombinase XerD